MSAADALCRDAVPLHRAGRWEEAEALYRRALALAPTHLGARDLLGVLCHSQGRNDEALALLAAAVADNPAAIEVLANYAAVLKAVGRGEEAFALYERVLAQAPDHAGALNGRGAVLMDRNRFDAALEAYDAALAAQPDFAVALANRGRALQYLGRFDAARADLLRALTLAPDQAGFYLDLVETTPLQPGDPLLAQMETLLQKPGLADAARIQLHFALGKAHADLGAHDRSFRHLLEGNRLKRAAIAYDEAAAMAFFDRIEAIFTPALLRRLAGRGDLSRRPIFILGMMRSGSTLVEQILASHPAVHGAGELPTFIRRSGALGVYPDCVAEMDDDALPALARDYLAELQRLAPAAARVTDKMPSNFFWTGLIHFAFPNAAIIHTTRDAIDTCVSCFSKLFTEDQPHAYDLGELGRFHRRHDKLMAHWHAVLPPGCILEVRYEDVVADLERQARRIVAHCGLDWDERCLAFHQTARPVRTASVAQVRQPLYGAAVGRARPYEAFLGPLRAALMGK